jgi:hypothetical protein
MTSALLRTGAGETAYLTGVRLARPPRLLLCPFRRRLDRISREWGQLVQCQRVVEAIGGIADDDEDRYYHEAQSQICPYTKIAEARGVKLNGVSLSWQRWGVLEGHGGECGRRWLTRLGSQCTEADN